MDGYIAIAELIKFSVHTISNGVINDIACGGVLISNHLK